MDILAAILKVNASCLKCSLAAICRFYGGSRPKRHGRTDKFDAHALEGEPNLVKVYPRGRAARRPEPHSVEECDHLLQMRKLSLSS